MGGLKTSNKTKVEGGMASMTDLVFLLLIFFIIMSLMSNSQVTVDLPEAGDPAPPPEQEQVQPTVEVTEDDLYKVLSSAGLSQELEFDDIKELAAAAVTESEKTKLKIAGHRKASYEAVFKVLALCQANGWDPVLAYEK